MKMLQNIIFLSYRFVNLKDADASNKQAIMQNHKIVKMKFIFMNFDKTIYFFKYLQSQSSLVQMMNCVDCYVHLYTVFFFPTAFFLCNVAKMFW